jgi:hypothetical protein
MVSTFKGENGQNPNGLRGAEGEGGLPLRTLSASGVGAPAHLPTGIS